MNVRLNGSAISDFPSFHTECQRVFGFPSFYGRNMDAWIDCLSYLYDDDGMVGFRLAPGEVLGLDLVDSNRVRAQAPDVVQALVDCTEFVNQRFVAVGIPAAIALTLVE